MVLNSMVRGGGREWFDQGVHMVLNSMVRGGGREGWVCDL